MENSPVATETATSDLPDRVAAFKTVSDPTDRIAAIKAATTGLELLECLEEIVNRKDTLLIALSR